MSGNAMSAFDQVLSRLPGTRPSGGGFKARCPGHKDRRASLTVKESPDGTVLIHCHAGCAPETVLDAMGLVWADLFPTTPSSNGHQATERREIVAVYDYGDFEVVRFFPKRFAQRRKDGSWGLGDIRPHLYRRGELLAAPANETVYVPEGEKDVEALRSLGLIATCNPMGAGKWRQEYADDLAGRHVVIIPDADAPGRRHAQEVAGSVVGVAASVKVIELPRAKDVSEWLDQGNTLEELEAFAHSVGSYAPSVHSNAKGDGVPPSSKKLIPALAEAILQDHHFAVDVAGRLCRYESGVYKADAGRLINALVKHILEGWGLAAEWSSHKAAEVALFIEADAAVIPEMPSMTTLNLTNGLLDIVDPGNPVLRPHTPWYLSLVQLPVEFDPTAVCIEVNSFLVEVVPADCLDLIFEILGVLVMPGKGRRWAILLVGEGGTGKSTTLILLRRWLGKRHVSTLSLQKLESNRFATSRLVGKLVNVFADLPDTHLATTSIFRSITGGDSLEAEFKHKDGFDFDPIVRLIFSANHYPRSADASSAFFDRWVVVPFERRFRDTEYERDQEELLNSLTTPTEASGMLNEALAGLARFSARGHRYEMPSSVTKALEEFRATTDPLSVWIDRRLVVQPDAFIQKDNLLRAYNDAARKDGNKTHGATSFAIALRRARPDLFNDASESQKTLAGSVKRVWAGVGLIGAEA